MSAPEDTVRTTLHRRYLGHPDDNAALAALNVLVAERDRLAKIALAAWRATGGDADSTELSMQEGWDELCRLLEMEPDSFGARLTALGEKQT